MMRPLLAAACVSIAGLLACSDEAPPPSPRRIDLGSDVVARVGDVPISILTVQRIAVAQGISLEEARDRALRDAVFAAEAEARGLRDAELAAAVDARVLFAELRREESERPIGDEELQRVVERRWLALRRPAGRRLVHVVVRLPPKSEDETLWDAAFAVGAEIREAVEGAAIVARAQPFVPGSDEAALEFRDLAKSVDAAGFQTKVEELGDVAADGRVLKEGSGTLDATFMEGVAALRARGELAGPFRTPFGVHVVLQTNSTPAVELTHDELLERAKGEIVDDRLRARSSALLKGRLSVEVPVNAPALLDLVRVQ